MDRLKPLLTDTPRALEVFTSLDPTSKGTLSLRDARTAFKSLGVPLNALELIALGRKSSGSSATMEIDYRALLHKSTAAPSVTSAPTRGHHSGGNHDSVYMKEVLVFNEDGGDLSTAAAPPKSSPAPWEPLPAPPLPPRAPPSPNPILTDTLLTGGLGEGRKKLITDHPALASSVMDSEGGLGKYLMLPAEPPPPHKDPLHYSEERFAPVPPATKPTGRRRFSTTQTSVTTEPPVELEPAALGSSVTQMQQQHHHHHHHHHHQQPDSSHLMLSSLTLPAAPHVGGRGEGSSSAHALARGVGEMGVTLDAAATAGHAIAGVLRAVLPVESTSAAVRMKAALRRVDKDGDGGLNPNELMTAINSLLPSGEEVRAREVGLMAQWLLANKGSAAAATAGGVATASVLPLPPPPSSVTVSVEDFLEAVTGRGTARGEESSSSSDFFSTLPATSTTAPTSPSPAPHLGHHSLQSPPAAAGYAAGFVKRKGGGLGVKRFTPSSSSFSSLTNLGDTQEEMQQQRNLVDFSQKWERRYGAAAVKEAAIDKDMGFQAKEAWKVLRMSNPPPLHTTAK